MVALFAKMDDLSCYGKLWNFTPTDKMLSGSLSSIIKIKMTHIDYVSYKNSVLKLYSMEYIFEEYFRVTRAGGK